MSHPSGGPERGLSLTWHDAHPAPGGANTGERDGEGFGQALEACRQYLRMLAVRELDRSLAGKEGVSDLVQETFLDAHRGQQDFRGRTRAEFLAWLREILRHNAANLVRRYRTAARAVDRERRIDDATALGVDALVDRDASPSGHAVAREQADALRRALERVPERDRQVLAWRHHEQLSYEQIAARLGSTPDAARMAWARAVRRVQRELTGDRTEGGDGSS